MRIPRAPLLILLLLLVTGIPSFAEFYTDWLWFQEAGYEQVFLRTITTRAGVAAVAGLATFAVLALNLGLALGALRAREFTVMTAHGPQTIVMNPRRLRPIVFAG